MFCVTRGYGVFFTEDSFRDVERGRRSSSRPRRRVAF